MDTTQRLVTFRERLPAAQDERTPTDVARQLVKDKNPRIRCSEPVLQESLWELASEWPQERCGTINPNFTRTFRDSYIKRAR